MPKKVLKAFKEQNPDLAPYVMSVDTTHHTGYTTVHVVLKSEAPSPRPGHMTLPNGKTGYVVYNLLPASLPPAPAYPYTTPHAA